jgi:hypothetical protein
MYRLLILLTLLGFILFGLGSNALALETYYNNKGGYNNKIPYSLLFEKPKPKQQIKIQRSVGKGQAVIPLNQDKQDIKQKGLD